MAQAEAATALPTLAVVAMTATETETAFLIEVEVAVVVAAAVVVVALTVAVVAALTVAVVAAPEARHRLRLVAGQASTACPLRLPAVRQRASLSTTATTRMICQVTLPWRGVV